MVAVETRMEGVGLEEGGGEPPEVLALSEELFPLDLANLHWLVWCIQKRLWTRHHQ